MSCTKKEQAVIDTARAFVLQEWSEMQELEGSESMSLPAEYMLLHQAVCELNGWASFGPFPIQEDAETMRQAALRDAARKE